MKLSWREKLSYGIGATGKDMVCGLVFTYALIYFTDVAMLPEAFVGVLFFVAKLWDAVNDLAMGTIVDNTRTKFGKFRPWLVIGTLVNAVVFVILFTDFGLDTGGKMVFVSILYVLWGMTYTMMDIPYWSMLPNLATDPHERETVSVIPRIFASIGGNFIVGGLGLAIIGTLGKKGPEGGMNQLGMTRFAWIIAIVFVVTIGITVLNVKSADTVQGQTQEKTTFKQMFHIIAKNDQLLVAIGVILTFNLAIQIMNSVSTFYFIYVTHSTTLFGTFTLLAGVAEVIGLFLFPALAKRLSRTKIYFLACACPVAGLLLLGAISYAAPQNIVLTGLAGFLVKLGSGFSLGTVTVVLADVVDYGEYKFGTRNESVTFSTQTLVVKLSSAVGALLTGGALQLTGYIPKAAVQCAATITGLRVIMIVIPIVCAIVSFVLYKTKFKLNGEYYQRIMNVLALRNNKLDEHLEDMAENPDQIIR